MDIIALAYAAQDRFWTKVDKGNGTGCWLWTAGQTKRDKPDESYGLFGLGRESWRMYRAHRIAWMLATGTNPGDTWVLHRCDTPLCVRYEHLFLGDAKANSMDMAAKGRCALQRPEMHRHGEAHPMSKLTDQQIRAVRANYAMRPTDQRELADQLGIAQSSLSLILRGETRCDAGGPITRKQILSDSELFEIRRRSAGERQVDLAREYGIAACTVNNIIHGRYPR